MMGDVEAFQGDVGVVGVAGDEEVLHGVVVVEFADVFLKHVVVEGFVDGAALQELGDDVGDHGGGGDGDHLQHGAAHFRHEKNGEEGGLHHGGEDGGHAQVEEVGVVDVCADEDSVKEGADEGAQGEHGEEDAALGAGAVAGPDEEHADDEKGDKGLGGDGGGGQPLDEAVAAA